jgi:hypothetical protein
VTYYQGGPLDMLLTRLGGVKKCGERYMAKCPAHKDNSPSLSLSRGNDGRALVHCHAGCELSDVLGAVGLELRDLFLGNLSREQKQQYQREKLEAERRFELLVIEAGNSEAKTGELSDGEKARLVLAQERKEQLDRQLAELGLQSEQARPSLVEVPLVDVMSANPELVRFAVSPWMPRRHVTLFGGHGGIGKSSLALAIGAHVACGLPFAGLEVEKSAVLIVSLEDEASIVRYRLRRIIDEYRLPAEHVLDSLRLLDGTKAFSALMTEGEGFNAGPIFTPAFRELASYFEGVGLVFIDNASDAFDANENSRRAVRTFVRALANLAQQHNTAVVLLAHIDKASAKSSANGNSYSGSTAWHNSARSRLALLEKDGRVLLAHEKANLSELAEPVVITFVDGVPMPESGGQGDGATAEDFDCSKVILAMQAAQDVGINVPASLNPGAHSAMSALGALPEYVHTFRGKQGNQRAARAIAALIRAGRIRRVEYKTLQRKNRERLELVEVPKAGSGSGQNKQIWSAESALRRPPITPERIGAAHWDACASAPIMIGAAPDTIGATLGTYESVASTEPTSSNRWESIQ